MSQPVINPGKCCVECAEMFIEMASPGYSDLTPGNEFDMYCRSQVWTFDRYGTEQEYRNCILTAPRCPHFKERV